MPLIGISTKVAFSAIVLRPSIMQYSWLAHPKLPGPSKTVGELPGEKVATSVLPRVTLVPFVKVLPSPSDR